MPPIKLGIIGCGIAARELHLPPLLALRDQFEIAVVCNHTEAKAREFSQMAGNVPYVLDYRQVLAMPEIEAVDIILPIELNYRVTHDALTAGKHVLVEKPLAANLAEARSMVQLEKETPRVTMVAENFRYSPAFAAIRQYLEQGQIGKVQAVFWNKFYHMDAANQYVQTQWRIAHKHQGGFITDGGVHQIAVLRDLCGDLTGCGAFTKRMNPAIGKVDSLSFQFKTTQDVNGVLNIFASSPDYQEDRLLLIGETGSITFADNLLTLQKNGRTIIREQFQAADLGYKQELEAFYEAVRHRQPVKSSFFEAYCDLKGILDALQLAGGES